MAAVLALSEAARTDVNPLASVVPAIDGPAPLPEPNVSEPKESLSPSLVDVRNTAPAGAKKKSHALLKLGLPAAVVIAAALILQLRSAPPAPQPAPRVTAAARPETPRAAPPSKSEADPTRATESPLSTAAPAAEPPPSAPPSEVSSAEATAAGPVSVRVHVTPKGSIIFHRGRRLGVNTVQVDVERGGKKTLVALTDGYVPRRFVIDDSAPNVEIELSRQGMAAPANTASKAAGAPAPSAPRR